MTQLNKPKRCQFVNCKKIPIFGDPTNKIALFCAEHKNETHIDVKSKTCQFVNCKKNQFLEIQLIK